MGSVAWDFVLQPLHRVLGRIEALLVLSPARLVPCQLWGRLCTVQASPRAHGEAQPSSRSEPLSARERLPESTAPQPMPRALLIFTRNRDIHTYKHLKLVPFRVVPTILVLLYFIYNGDLVWTENCVGKLEFAGQLRGF